MVALMPIITLAGTKFFVCVGSNPFLCYLCEPGLVLLCFALH